MSCQIKKSECSLVSKYRAVLMGIAIILIMLCHLDIAQTHHGIQITSLAHIFHFFTVGVDIFLFLSGMGLYYSYTKNKQSYFKFEKKRIIRVVPYYLVIAGITYFISDILIQHLTAGKFFSDLLFISWFSAGNTKYWYILAIIVFYLLFPVLYKFIHNGKYGLAKTLILCVLIWSAVELLCQWIDGLGNFRIALERLPIFLIGIWLGKLAFNKKQINKAVVIVLFICGYFLFAVSKLPVFNAVADHFNYVVRCMLAISIIITVVFIMELLERFLPRAQKGIVSVLKWFGGLTLEMYLLHQSFLILFDFPCQLIKYLMVAFILPVVTAAAIFLVRMLIKKKRKA